MCQSIKCCKHNIAQNLSKLQAKKVTYSAKTCKKAVANATAWFV